MPSKKLRPWKRFDRLNPVKRDLLILARILLIASIIVIARLNPVKRDLLILAATGGG